MPVAQRPDPLLMLGTPSGSRGSPGGAAAGAPLAGPGSSIHALAQAQPAARDPAAPPPERAPQRPTERVAASASEPPHHTEPGARPPAAADAPSRATPSGRGKPGAAPARHEGDGAKQGVTPAHDVAPEPASDDPSLDAAAPTDDITADGEGPDAAPLALQVEATQTPVPAAAPFPAAAARRLAAKGGDAPALAAAAPSTDAPTETRSTAGLRDGLRPLAASLPAPIARATPQRDVDAATRTDAEDDDTPLALVGSTRRVAAALGDSVQGAAQPSTPSATTALAAHEASVRSATLRSGDGPALAPVREGSGLRLDGLPTLLPGGATPLAPAGTPSVQAGSAVASLAPPLDHPDFAQALGAQVAVWAVGGQHEAELQLNPGNMGPVQVWIGVDGAQAQVRFTADLAATRDALSAALPQLEQALAREGLQLGGADVQGRDARAGSGSHPGDDPAPRSRTRSGASTAGAEPLGLGSRPPLATRGLIDLYA